MWSNFNFNKKNFGWLQFNEDSDFDDDDDDNDDIVENDDDDEAGAGINDDFMDKFGNIEELVHHVRRVCFANGLIFIVLCVCRWLSKTAVIGTMTTVISARWSTTMTKNSPTSTQFALEPPRFDVNSDCFVAVVRWITSTSWSFSWRGCKKAASWTPTCRRCLPRWSTPTEKRWWRWKSRRNTRPAIAHSIQTKIEFSEWIECFIERRCCEINQPRCIYIRCCSEIMKFSLIHVEERMKRKKLLFFLFLFL